MSAFRAILTIIISSKILLKGKHKSVGYCWGKSFSWIIKEDGNGFGELFESIRGFFKIRF
jgi:hypothetical protein